MGFDGKLLGKVPYNLFGAMGGAGLGLLAVSAGVNPSMGQKMLTDQMVGIIAKALVELGAKVGRSLGDIAQSLQHRRQARGR